MYKTRVAITVMWLGSLGCAATVSQPNNPKPARGERKVPVSPTVTMQGAGWVIDHLQKGGAPRDAADSAKQAKREALASEAKALRHDVKKLSAAEYAERWVALAKRYSGATGTSRGLFASDDDKTLLPLFEALPEPAGWPALVEALRKHAGARATSTEKAFALLASALARDADRGQILSALERDRSLSPQVSQALRQLTQRGMGPMDQARGPVDPKDLEVYVSRMEALVKAKPVAGAAPATLMLSSQLLKVGEARAKALITRLVTSADVKLSTEDDDTAKLAYAIALANADKLKVAQWDLVRSLDDLELMRTLWKRFGVPAAPVKKDDGLHNETFGDEEYGYGRGHPAAAVCMYALALVKAGEHDAALEVAKVLPADAWRSHRCLATLREMDTVAHAGALYSFFSELTKVQPEAHVQSWLGMVSIPAGRGEEYRTLARSALQGPSSKVRRQWLQGMFNSLLADDLVQEAKQLALDNPGELDAPPSPAPQPTLYASDVGVLFAHLGRLAKDDALIDEGLALSKRIPADPRGRRQTIESSRCELLLELQRYAQAEQCIVGAMAKLLQPSEEERALTGMSDGELPRLLSLLTRTYGATGHYNDVMTLLERAPWWGASELEDLTERQDVETTVAVARALHATGKTQAAVALLQRRILLGTGDDRPYRLLVEIGDPSQLLSWFDAVHALDRFQERPLMWKAKVLLAQGKLDDAERTAKRALGVDPSDGEAQPGQRIHGYGVMSEILAARGATKDAEFFGKVVRAIRISERADEMRDLGLVKRALATYRESESLFSDAYCVHWRMADQLHGLGWLDEAKKHYRIAFQHMPHQFGRVASICMHCADVFGREYVRGIAENVFSEIIAAEPNNARGYHFLAQVRFEQSRRDEGIALLKKAVAIDPEYADAWHELLDKLGERPADLAEAENIRLRLFELDPLGIHGGNVRGVEIQDLARLWSIALAHKHLELPEPPRHVVLPAAAEHARSLPAQARHARFYERDNPLPYALPAPGAVLKAQPALNLVAALIGTDVSAQPPEALPAAHLQ